MAYSCIVGNGFGVPPFAGDGVVDADRADLNNYLLAQPPLDNLNADKFESGSNHLTIHQQNHDLMIRGLDEPAFHDLAYPVPLNVSRYAFISEQAENHEYPTIDLDDYKIEIPENGKLKINVSNIPCP